MAAFCSRTAPPGGQSREIQSYHICEDGRINNALVLLCRDKACARVMRRGNPDQSKRFPTYEKKQQRNKENKKTWLGLTLDPDSVPLPAQHK